MDTIIIGQGYNLAMDSSVGKELISLFDSQRYTSFICLVAFASLGGISALTDRIEKAKHCGMRIKIILGVDQHGTSKEALEEVLSWEVESYIYHTSDFNIFHPKIYLFENEDIFSLIVGSNNLTVPGLVQNVECSLMIKDIKSNPILQNFYSYWNGLINGTEVNLYPITQEIIDNLFADGIVPLEAQRIKIYDHNSVETFSSDRENRCAFRKVGIQPLPEGFNPKRKIRKIRINPNKENRTDSKKDLYVSQDVLIAEIGGGQRWKQVNFPIKIFQEFFGASPNVKEYTIDLLNISEDNTLGEVETRKAVTVKSNNYRFEINCHETSLPYPSQESGRPIGIFLKLSPTEFTYKVLMPSHEAYEVINNYLSREAPRGRAGQLKRVIVDIEAIRALYPELII